MSRFFVTGHECSPLLSEVRRCRITRLKPQFCSFKHHPVTRFQPPKEGIMARNYRKQLMTGLRERIAREKSPRKFLRLYAWLFDADAL